MLGLLSMRKKISEKALESGGMPNETNLNALRAVIQDRMPAVLDRVKLMNTTMDAVNWDLSVDGKRGRAAVAHKLVTALLSENVLEAAHVLATMAQKVITGLAETMKSPIFDDSDSSSLMAMVTSTHTSETPRKLLKFTSTSEAKRLYVQQKYLESTLEMHEDMMSTCMDLVADPPQELHDVFDDNKGLLDRVTFMVASLSCIQALYKVCKQGETQGQRVRLTRKGLLKKGWKWAEKLEESMVEVMTAAGLSEEA